MDWKKLLKTPAQKRAEEEALAKKQQQAEERKAKREAKKAAEVKKAQDANNPKARASAAGEPWIQVLNVELDPENPGAGAFELDWNDVFVARLVKSGYQGKTDQDIVDNWFQDVCRHVVMETFEQEQADPDKRNQTIQRKDIGGGKAEFS